MQTKQDLSAAFNDIIQRPGVSIPIEAWLDLDIVERGTNIADDPKDQLYAHPRLTNEHGDILARQP